MSPRWQSLIRLLGVQASWTYERMSGIGLAHAAAPLLRDLFRDHSPERRRAAVARSAEYFNSHPYLAGVAVGAVVKAEYEDVPSLTISRLRTALSGPLGALGDQVIWAGEVPALMGLSLASVPLLGWWAVPVLLVIHNVLRLRLTLWGLDLGLREGLKVGAALEQSWLPRVAGLAQRLAAFAVGFGTIVVTGWLLDGRSDATRLGVAGIAVAGLLLLLSVATRTRVTGIRYGLVLIGLSLLVIGGLQ